MQENFKGENALWARLKKLNLISSLDDCTKEDFTVAAKYYPIAWLKKCLNDEELRAGIVDEFIHAAEDEVMERQLFKTKKLRLP